MRWPRLATARHLAGAAIARLPVRSPLTLRLMASALVEAARAGKEVTVVIELRARFEEEANIELANDLQEAGAHVVYGVVGHKTYAKMILVVRREDKQLRRYVHLGTGNYHARTARLYTDYGLFICDTAIGEDVHKVLQQLTALGRPGKLKKLLQSPFTLHKTMLKYIEREAKFAQEGKPARIARQCHVAAIADNALHAIALLDRCHKGDVAREVRLSKIPELVRREGLAEPEEPIVARLRSQPGKVICEPFLVIGADGPNIDGSAVTQHCMSGVIAEIVDRQHSFSPHCFTLPECIDRSARAVPNDYYGFCLMIVHGETPFDRLRANGKGNGGQEFPVRAELVEA
jgi:hypothetical protein